MILRSIAALLLVLFATAKGDVSKSVVYTVDPWLRDYSACIDQEGGMVVNTIWSVDYRYLDGDFVTRAVFGMPIPVPGDPSGSVEILGIPSESKPVRAVLPGKIAFVARVSNTPFGSIPWNAIISSDESGLKVVARLGDLLPGTNEPISSLDYSICFDQSGDLIFFAKGANSFNPRMLKWSHGGLETVSLDPVFTPESYAVSVLISNSGEMVGTGRFATTPGSIAKLGLARLTPGASSLIARQGDPVPGFPLETFSSDPTLYSINAAGDVLFRAVTQRSTPGSSPGGGLWLARVSGGLELIVPDRSPTDAVVNASGDVAYRALGLHLKRAGQNIETIVSSPTPPVQFQNLTHRLGMNAQGDILFQSAAGIWVRMANGQIIPIAKVDEVVRHGGVDYKISELNLVSSDSGGEDGRPLMMNDWGQIVFMAQLSRASKSGTTTNLNVVMTATLPGGGPPTRKPLAIPDTAYFRSGIGTAAKIDLLANDINPVAGRLSIASVTQGAFGKVSIRDGFVYYTPGKDFVTEDSFQYVASNQWGTSQPVTAIVRNPYRSAGGTYVTEVVDGATPVATVSATVTKSGRITGRILYDGQSFTLNGLFDGNNFIQSFALPHGGGVSIALHLDVSPGAPTRIYGTLDTPTTSLLEVKPTVALGLPSDVKAMKVTGQFRTEGDVSLPKGIGYLVGTLASNGRLVASGRLPDNQPFSASSRMKVDGTLAFDCAPYGNGRGRIHGLFTDGDAGALHRWDASLRWTKEPSTGSYPEGIDGTVTAIFATYAPGSGMPAISNTGPIAGGTFTATVNGDTSVSETLSWTRGDVVVFTPPNLRRLQLRVNRGNGLVTGSYLTSSRELHRFAGVVFSLGNGAVGLVIGDQATGSFILSVN